MSNGVDTWLVPVDAPLTARSSISPIRIWLVAILTVVFVQGAFTAFRFPEVSQGELIDTDTYMHLVRARDLLTGESFFNPVIERSNVPFGETQHWTRPFDVLLAAIATPVIPFTGLETALFAAALLVGPIVLSAIMVAFYWAVRPVISSKNRQLSLIVLASQLALLAYSTIGRADHHGVLLLLLTLCVGLLLRMMTSPVSSRYAGYLGVCLAGGLWVSTEFLAMTGIAFLSLGVAWIFWGKKFAHVGRRASVSMLASVAAAVLFERGPRWTEIEYDRISLVHVALALIISSIFYVGSLVKPDRSVPVKFAVSAGASVVGLAILRGVFPGVLGGPWAPIDPTIRRIWLDHVAELQPLFPGWGGDPSLAVIYLGAPLLGLALVAVGALRRRTPVLLWVPVFLGAPIFLFLALRYARFAPHAEIFGAVPLMWGLDRGLNRADAFSALPKLLSRLGLSVSCCLGFLVVGALLPGTSSETNGPLLGQCNLKELALYLNDPESFSNRPRTILANMDFGSELLYRTNDRVIATPIRQQDAILDTYVAFTTADLSVSKRIIFDRQVDLVLICPAHDRWLFGDPPPKGSLDEALLANRIPEWLVTVELPAELSAFRLFATVP